MAAERVKKLADQNKLKILCLHGKQQLATVFEDQTAKMQKKLKNVATFTFVDAPFELTLKDGDDLRTRSWFPDVESSETLPQ